MEQFREEDNNENQRENRVNGGVTSRLREVGTGLDTDPNREGPWGFSATTQAIGCGWCSREG